MRRFVAFARTHGCQITLTDDGKISMAAASGTTAYVSLISAGKKGEVQMEPTFDNAKATKIRFDRLDHIVSAHRSLEALHRTITDFIDQEFDFGLDHKAEEESTPSDGAPWENVEPPKLASTPAAAAPESKRPVPKPVEIMLTKEQFDAVDKHQVFLQHNDVAKESIAFKDVCPGPIKFSDGARNMMWPRTQVLFEAAPGSAMSFKYRPVFTAFDFAESGTFTVISGV
jgi:hypothetical protein